MRRLGFLVRKEFQELRRNPRMFPVIFVAPVLQLFILGYAATTDVKNVPLMVVDADRSAASRDLIARFDGSPYFSIVDVTTNDADIQRAIESRRAWMALSIPPEYGEMIGRGQPVVVQVITDGAAPTLPYDFIRLFIVSAKAAKDFSTKETANEGFNSGKAAIGTGPYKFVSWTPKDQLVLERYDGYWGGKEPWQRVLRKEIPNDTARVAQLKAGQLDLIARAPAADVPTLEKDGKLTVVKIDTVYVFNMELDLREKAPQITARDGSALPQNPLRDPRVREAIDLAIDRPALAEVAMEGMGKPVNQLVTPSIFGYNKSLPERKLDIARAKKLLADAGYPNGFKATFSFTNDRLPGDRQVGTSVAQMLAAIGLDVTANAQPAAVFFPARTRGDFSMPMSGWGTLTGEAHYTLSSTVHSNDPVRKFGPFNVLGYNSPQMDKLIQDAAIEMDVNKRRSYLEQANALVATDRPRLPLVSVGSAWAMQKSKVTIKPRVDEDTLAMNIKPAK